MNNAGANKPADFDQITDADWDEIMAVNLKGPFLCAQEALPALRRRGGGSIVNIGSVSGQYGGPRTAHYAASKAGLISLGQVIARFGAKDNIRCNTVAAGLIESEMAAAGMQSEAVKKAAAGILLEPAGHARGSRPGRRVPGVGCEQLHYRADDQRQRRSLFLTRRTRVQSKDISMNSSELRGVIVPVDHADRRAGRRRRAGVSKDAPPIDRRGRAWHFRGRVGRRRAAAGRCPVAANGGNRPR